MDFIIIDIKMNRYQFCLILKQKLIQLLYFLKAEQKENYNFFYIMNMNIKEIENKNK